MRIPGFTSEMALAGARTSDWKDDGYTPGRGAIEPQTRLCTECDGRFVGSRRCCDMQIIFCKPGVPCIVSFTNCQTESCGLLVSLVGLLS